MPGFGVVAPRKRIGPPAAAGAVWAVAVAAALLLAAAPAWAAATVHARLDRLTRTYDVRSDQTWIETITIDTTVVTQRGVRENERGSYTFYPKSQTLELAEAWVDQPDGKRLYADASARFTRPSEAAQNAPGFTSAETTTVLFPQVHEGSRTHAVWRVTQTTPALLGFNVEMLPPPDMPVGEASVTISAPAELKLHWASRGGFAVSEHTEGGQHIIAARIADTAADEPERNMVDETDFAPLFLATSLPGFEALGAIYFQQSQPKAVPTPEIAALAARVAAGQTGLAAARAVYDWVAANIRYVAVYMDPNDGWVPHPAADVLHRGYGDCKDHVVLMQAMLTALGIRSEPALIEQGTRTQDLPLWIPQFNHVIVYLPDYGQFANPTNPYARFDSLDRLLAGRTVVLATEHGAVSRTAPARPQDNIYTMSADLTVAAGGNLAGISTIVPSANLEAAARAAVTQALSPRDLAERLLSATPEGGFGMFETSDPRDLTQPFRMTGRWHSPHAVTFDGGEAFFTVPVGLDLDPAAHLRALLTDNGKRRHALLTTARDYRWTTVLHLPDGVAAARLPHDVSFENGAGSYSAEYQSGGAALRVIRRLVIGRALFSAAEDAALEALIYAALDDARAVLGLTRTP